MANHCEKEKDEGAESLRQHIVAQQLRVHETFGGLTSFLCTSCRQANIKECSANYLLMLDMMKQQLYNVMGIMRDLFADWPMQCDCMLKLDTAITTTFEMTKYLCSSYDNAYSIDKDNEEETRKLYDAIYKDAYRFHSLFVHVMTNCVESHTFMHSYHYPIAQKCVVCRYRDGYDDDDDDIWQSDDALDPAFGE